MVGLMAVVVVKWSIYTGLDLFDLEYELIGIFECVWNSGFMCGITKRVKV